MHLPLDEATERERKAAPIVATEASLKVPWTNLRAIADFPTADSPISTANREKKLN